jgi:hypothetical protein
MVLFHNITLRMFYEVDKNARIQIFVFSRAARQISHADTHSQLTKYFQIFSPQICIILAFGNLGRFVHFNFSEQVKQRQQNNV